MFDLVNRYAHGFIAIPVMRACERRGMFTMLRERGAMDAGQILQALGGNEGHLAVGLQLLESLAWLQREGQGLALGPRLEISGIPASIDALYRVPQSEVLAAVDGDWPYGRWVEMSRRAWDGVSPLLCDLLDGTTILPLLLALRGERDSRTPFAGLAEPVRSRVTALFQERGWCQPAGQGVELTESGRFLLEWSMLGGSTISYKPMMDRIEDVIFGDLNLVFARNEDGTERHVDRSLNVRASGFQHEKYFKAMREIVLEFFNREPLEAQPRYLMDTGSGDGTLLRSIYDAIASQSLRGRHLDTHPLQVLGVDFNEHARQEAARTLQGVPHRMLHGDIADPAGIAQTLRDAGVANLDDILHIRSFLDHDRPYRDATEHLDDRPIPTAAVSVDRQGRRISPQRASASLTQFLRSWHGLIGRHGIVIAEVHAVDVQTAGRFLDECEGVHYDAFHGFSGQYPVEPEVFLLAAGRAGLMPRAGSSMRYPREFPYTRITLHHFEKRPFRVRNARLSDLDTLLQIEAECWAPALQTPRSELQRRVELHPDEQFVVEQDGQPIGVCYTQPIAGLDDLQRVHWLTLGDIRDAQGTTLQLLGLNILPARRASGLGDQLLDFVLECARCSNRYQHVAGVSRCGAYAAQQGAVAMQDYIRLRDAGGRLVDPILGFHDGHGAQIVGLMPQFRPEDSDNLGHGVLVHYDLRGSATRRAAPVLDALATDTADVPALVEKLVRLAMDDAAEGDAQAAPRQLSRARPFMETGMESMQLLRLRSLLSEQFGQALDSAFLFRHNTINAVAAALRPKLEAAQAQARAAQAAAPAAPAMPPEPARASAPQAVPARGDEIAVVGIACRFPGGGPEGFWSLLRDGVDGVRPVPANRWWWPASDAAAQRFERAGYLDAIDAFDAPFFRISRAEAELIDPQQRLLLELSWELFEDAGHDPASLRGTATGVWIGACHFDYRDLVAHGAALSGHTATGTFGSILSNRLSYFFDLKGPSLSIDTACSSALVAVHSALQSLRRGECEQAVVGGVNLICTPTNTRSFARAGMLSPTGQCRTFDADADGYVRGEGAGLVLLKPLARALADGDQIYGLIAGSAVNHGGEANSLTAPSPRAQSDVITRAYLDGGLTPLDVDYVEAHGTGTRLGDPIELSALKEAFDGLLSRSGLTPPPDWACGVGSVKTAIGHLEGAAGMAGLIKVLLALRHRSLPGNLHFKALNPHIDLQGSPFQVLSASRPWAAGARPRAAGISSFGFGGVSGHVLVREWVQAGADAADAGSQIVPLSAPTDAQLRQSCAALLGAITRQQAAGAEPLRLQDVAWTLQAGRTAMAGRLAIVADTLHDLQRKLQGFLNGQRHEQVHHVSADVSRPDDAMLSGPEGEAFVRAVVQRGELGRVARLWAHGAAVDWAGLHAGRQPRRISLPTHPFAREAYWVPMAQEPVPAPAAADVVHPLLHRNLSDLSAQRYATLLTGREFFLADHVLQGRRVLPGAAYLEMARAAVALAAGVQGAGGIWLQDLVWLRPLVVDAEPVQIHIGLARDDDGSIQFQIYGGDAAQLDGQPVVYCQGRAGVLDAQSRPVLDLAAARARCQQQQLAADALYARYATAGFQYGAGLQALRTVSWAAAEAVTELALPASVAAGAAAYVLHPSLLDASLQGSIAALTALGQGGGFAMPFSVDRLEVHAACTPAMWAVSRRSAGSAADAALQKLDIDLCDAAGQVCVCLRGLSVRAADGALVQAAAGTLLWHPTWRDAAAPALAQGLVPALRQVLLFELPGVAASELQKWTDTPCAAWAAEGDVAARYRGAAQHLCAQLQGLLHDRPGAALLLQVLVPSVGDGALFGGLAGLLKTARLEHAGLVAQLIEVEAGLSPEALAGLLRDCARRPQATHLRQVQGRLLEAAWEELPAPASATAGSPWRDHGVYLLTGGAGGLGLLFAREIAQQAPGGHLILAGRSAPDEATQAQLRALQALGTHAVYRQLDVADAVQVARVLHDIHQEFGALHGIVHGAGVVHDGLLVNQQPAALDAVLGPKVAGLVHLDLASRGLGLDWIVCLSSMAGALGNLGQAGYAAANAFMDAYARLHDGAVTSQGERRRFLSLAWPLWEQGGMHMEAGAQRRWQQLGAQALPTRQGLDAFYAALASGQSQLLVLHGAQQQLRAWVAGGAGARAVQQAPAQADVSVGDGGVAASHDALRRTLRSLVSRLLRTPAGELDDESELSALGLDSISLTELANQVNQRLGVALSPTVFFEHKTLRAVIEHLAADHAAAVARALGASVAEPVAGGKPVAAPLPTPAWRFGRTSLAPARPAAAEASAANEPIAIIGISGRYPQAPDLQAYWHQLRDGRDCVTEVPPQRWDWREHYSSDRSLDGRHYSKWGGFIEGVDEFDPLFFNISPREARFIDPQERLFLQQAWTAVEDAGYTRAGLQVPQGRDLPGQVGVYVGVMYSEYQLLSAAAGPQAQRAAFGGSVSASIANRVSYVLNLHGPSMTLDTMCSSSLTAIHLACQDLRSGRTSMAIAGGVNVSIHPHKYVMLSAGQFISSDGHCQSFGEGGDGYIPGEGVGAVVLKRLADAERDGDPIHGVILGSALTHGGKTNGYTVPNPQAQSSAIARALSDAGISARHISYIEAHGTGTKLGDPIEIAALAKAFEPYTQDKGYCRIGSAKSNIGHCESAAGIAGLSKVLLQMKHGQIAPSLHAARLNPHIDFEQTPFVVNQSLSEWARPQIEGRQIQRIAGISSFGAGGSNAHVIVQEYEPRPAQPEQAQQALIVLSARTEEQLQQQAQQLLAHLQHTQAPLQALAYTLQQGREAMEQRLGLLVDSTQQLQERLQAYVQGQQHIEELYRGQARRSQEGMSLINQDEDMKEAVHKWIARKKHGKLLELWVQGLEVDWSQLYGANRPQRLNLPTYPFARERYWLQLPPAAAAASTQLHPLLHSNTSDLSEQSYGSWLQGQEFFLQDHQVQLPGGKAKVLPAVAYLEMAREALQRAQPQQGQDGKLQLQLQHTVWLQPVVVQDERKQISIALQPDEQGGVEYEIYSPGQGEQGEDTIHCQGRGEFVQATQPTPLDLGALQQQMQAGWVPAAQLYAQLQQMGLHYGPSHQAVQGLHRGAGQLLAQLQLPQSVQHDSQAYTLHPSLMDGALQACIGLMAPDDAQGTQPLLPYTVQSVRIIRPCTPQMLVWARHAADSTDTLSKLDIELCDPQGQVCVQMRGFSALRVGEQAATAEEDSGIVWAAPQWQAEAAAQNPAPITQRQLWLSGLPQINPEQLAAQLPGSTQCQRLDEDHTQDLAQRYTDDAARCLEQLQALLRSKPQGTIQLQLVVADQDQHSLWAGIAGLLKTAAQENPQLQAQLLLVPAHTDTPQLARWLQAEPAGNAQIRYREGQRQVQRWQEQPWTPQAWPVAYKDSGVYLITGGLGGLGRLFMQEIRRQAPQAQIIVTGRGKQTPELGAGVHYRQLDLSDLQQVRSLIQAIRQEHDQLNGILHSAGQIADNFILNKTAAELRAVLQPKVSGSVHLDEASADEPLDFLVLYSSIAGALGNVGQADYAAANAFMDHYAAWRNHQVGQGRRQGRTVAINWPLWAQGGMQMEQASQRWLHNTTGMQPLQTQPGLQALQGSLAQGHSQMLLMQGQPQRLRETLQQTAAALSKQAVQAVAAEPLDQGSLQEQTEQYLRREFSGVLQLPAHRIDPQAALETYGIDSVLAMSLTRQLEKTFGPLSKTLLFEFQTVAALASHFVRAHAQTVRDKIGTAAETSAVVATPASAELQPAPRARGRRRAAAPAAQRVEVAIVGVSGRYPQADDLDAYWDNLRSGRDCITEIPAGRWDNTPLFDADRRKAGTTYSKWGGFINDVDRFDPLFFGISPKEAELMDPQERLFLQTAWKTVEDAGYSKQSLAGRKVGVFVGVMWGQYSLLSLESTLRGNTSIAGSSHASIANRVSFVFDLHGPSIGLDTMCSSSLTALHLACEAIRHGEIEAAIAGGVNVSIHPHKYIGLSQGQYLSSDGRCRSFGAGGDGYVPGEGVGAVLLKRLDDALRDGDHVYAVVRSSGVNHGGKTNGYSVPNPNAQADLIRDVLQRGAVDPGTVNYVEAHGTGTSLGDPIEIKGLVTAFEAAAGEPAACPIGSVKSNIGHLESAAGIAAVTKVLLQMKHRQLVPSLHALPANPYIAFDASPFRVQTELADWTPRAAQPLRACISSFGAGGSNAHVVLDEGPGARQPAPQAAPAGPQIVLLSARDADALGRYVQDYAGFLARPGVPALADIAATTQLGRSALGHRLAFVAGSTQELQDQITRWLAKQQGINGVHEGDIRAFRDQAGSLVSGQTGQVFVRELLQQRDLPRLAQLWTLGVDIPWSQLRSLIPPRRVSLPTYPFARERYWIDAGSAPIIPAATTTPRPEADSGVCYQPRWKATALPPRATATASDSPLLLLGASDTLAQALGAGGAGAIVRVQWGDAYRNEGNLAFVLDPQQEAHFQQMVQSLHAARRLPLQVVHCGTEVADTTRPTQALESLLWLCQAYIKHKPQAPVQLLATYSTSPAEHAPHGAALAGYFRSLSLEHPRFVARTLDLHCTTAEHKLTAELQAMAILDELADGPWSGTTVVRRSWDPQQPGQAAGRHISELARLPAAPAAIAQLPLKQHGVYLITGGLGGLGLLFSEHLARSCQATLVLVGRSEIGAEQARRIAHLQALGAQVRYLRADVAVRADVDAVLQAVKAEFPALHGVLHAAGVTRDAYVLKKTREDLAQVLAPKIDGTRHLDAATRDEQLDWFVLFSSVAAEMGNPGQCDYAYANRYLDVFAQQRDGLRLAGRRSGRTLSINWPLWVEGGMQIAAADVARIERDTGIRPLPTAEGLRCWEELLQSGLTQGLVLYGQASKIDGTLQRTSTVVRTVSKAAAEPAPAALMARTQQYLQTLLGEEVKLPPERVDVHERFEAYGVDSVMIARINAQLERGLGPVSKTLLFEHETVEDLARHLVQELRPALSRLFDDGAVAPTDEAQAPAADAALPATAPAPAPAAAQPLAQDEPIAIIGVHGQYPKSADLQAYWDNLRQGRDLVDLVPAERWDAAAYFDPDPQAAGRGKIYCQWGAFLDDADKFDPAFFNMSAEEARGVDPQERLFLQSVWSAIEDAGYTRDSLRRQHPRGKGAAVGVYVGVTSNSYQMLQAEYSDSGPPVQPSAMAWSIANRVSYFFDFEGPSMPVDTACSSSLVAVHLACDSLRRGECEVAVAGGVNLYLHPAKYQSLCGRRMLSSDGHCHSYGADGDGFVPGEGVGSLVLKPLRQAVADGDRIHGVVRSSAYAHSGRSNGYAAPNPNAQASLIDRALAQAGIHPESIGYVEGHGTGTQMGDSIEIAALTQAFRRHTPKLQFCPIGSVKANAGHAESAAGIAGISKVLLQMQHRQLVPSIHAETVNPSISFDNSPFYLQRGLTDWAPTAAQPLRALVNSFGAGGVNACVVLEAYDAPPPAPQAAQMPTQACLFTLSARDEPRLRAQAQLLLAHMAAQPELDLASLCHTLQVGREAMAERLAAVVSGGTQPQAVLRAWLDTGVHAAVLRGRATKRPAGRTTPLSLAPDASDAELQACAQAWVAGGAVAWGAPAGGAAVRRIGLPTYPFEKTRYWLDEQPAPAPSPQPAPAAPTSRLHPLVSHNASTLMEVGFSSRLSDKAFYALDHQVGGEPIFPGAGFVEMALACGGLAAEQPVLRLRDVVWIHPLSFRNGPRVLRTVLKRMGDGVEYSISSLGDDHERLVHAEGRLLLQDGAPVAAGSVDIRALQQGCTAVHAGPQFYQRLAACGLVYGPALQVVTEVHVAATHAVARLELPASQLEELDQYTLHPSLLDGALQSVAALLAGAGADQPCLPFALDEVDIVRPLTPVCHAHVEPAQANRHGRADIRKFNVRLLSERGELLVRLGNLYVRQLTDHPLAAPRAPAPSQVAV